MACCLASATMVVLNVTSVTVSGRLGMPAGREGPGKAFRLYKEETFQALPAASAPEIQRVSLALLMLQLKQLGIEQPQDFDFMDR